MPPLIEPLKNLVLQANQTEEWVSCDNWSEMKSFLQKAGLNRLVRSQTLTVSFKKPWNFLAENTVAAQRATTESERNLEWWSRQESNLRPSHCERDALPTELRPHHVNGNYYGTKKTARKRKEPQPTDRGPHRKDG